MTHSLLYLSQENPSELLLKGLKAQGYDVHSAALDMCGWQAYKNAFRNVELPHVVLVEIGTNRSGVRSMRDLVRSWEGVPLIVIGASHIASLAVQALDAGVEDFIAQPYAMEVLLARVRAVLRRHPEGPHIPAKAHLVDLDGLNVDLQACRVTKDGLDIRLTKTEFRIIACLIGKLDEVCSHDELLSNVWGWEYFDSNHYLHVYLGRIRSKLGAVHSTLLETVPGWGYILHSRLPILKAAV